VKFAQKKFVRNVFIVASGTAMSQAITMAFSPVITRLYSPEAFGLLGVFMALVAVLTPAAALTYPIAIVLPRSDYDARGIARLAAYIAFALSFLVAVILLVSGDHILGLLDAQDISSYILLLPLAMLFAALMQIAQQWVIRKKQFGIAARAEVLKALLVNTAKVGIGWFYPLAAVLIVLSTLGQVIHAGILGLGIKRSSPSAAVAREEAGSNSSLWELAQRHRDFPLYRAPQVLINSVSQNLPVLMLAAFFGPASAGFYAICRNVLGMPTRLIGKSVGDVFYPRITEAAYRGENLTRLILKATLCLAAVGFVPFALVVAFGPWLFGLIFGAEWVVAGEYARWLSIMMFFLFINKPSVAAVPVLNLQGGLLIYELFSTGSKLVAIYIGAVLFADDKLAIAIFSGFGALAYIFLIGWVILSSHFLRRKSTDAPKTS
jgi:O-antigen/teichoic acid export membrane protein